MKKFDRVTPNSYVKKDNEHNVSISKDAGLNTSGILFEKTNPRQDKKNEELKQLMKDCIKEWCSDTTSHGFSNMVKTDSWAIRIAWIVLIVLSMGYCIYSVYLVILSYLSYGVVTSYQIVVDSPAEFPSVTLCNLNAIDLSSESTTGTYINTILNFNQISGVINVTDLPDDIYGITLVDEAARLLKAYITADKSLNETELKKKGFTMDQLIISCYYNKLPCNSSDFKWIRSNEFGNCYTFNALVVGQAIRTTSKAGPEFGLNLEIFIGITGASDYYVIKNGIHVIVHNPGEMPLFKNEGIDVQTQTDTNIAISKTKYSKYDPPYSTCRRDVSSILPTDSEVYKQTLKISKYRQKLCYEMCLQTFYIIPKCNCSDPTIPITDPSQIICYRKIELECVRVQRDHFDELDISDACDRYCPLECESTTYSLSTSSAAYPSDYYWNIIKFQSNILAKTKILNQFTPSQSSDKPGPMGRRKRQIGFSSTPSPSIVGSSTANSNTISTGLSTTSTKLNSNTVSGGSIGGSASPVSNSPAGGSSGSFPTSNSASDSMRTSILKISVFYDELKYTSVEEAPSMDFITLIGVIGLFMGASFLSFAEVIEMLINLVRVAFRYNKLKQKIIQNHNS